jgi:nucleoside-diphosphate-sugar epimerase
MRILVTGITGVVGRSLARQLVAAGNAVSGIAEYPHDCLDPAVDFVPAPLDDPVLQELADDADAVIHLAPVDTSAPGGAGIQGVVHVTDAAARAGARLLFVSPACGDPRLYRQAEALVSSAWTPSLIIRIAPPVGRQLDWMVCRTVATLLRAKPSPQPLRVLHLDDLVRFLILAVATGRDGSVDLATPDTTHVLTARRLLASGPRLPRLHCWTDLAPELDTSALQEDWMFEFGWRATEAVADTVRGLTGRKLEAFGAVDLPGHRPLPLEPVPRSEPSDDTALRCAAPDGLEGEFDDRIDPRFPVFSATGLGEALPGPLTPMTLDVQLTGLRAASRVMAEVMMLGSVADGEWARRAIAVFGHRPYVGVSVSVLAAAQLPGWDERVVVERALGADMSSQTLLPMGRPPLAEGVLGSAAKAIVAARAVAMLRHVKSDTHIYHAAAAVEHTDAKHLAAMSDAELEIRANLLRNRIQQGWGLTALWVIDAGITAATLEHSRAHRAVSGVDTLLESQQVATEVAALASLLRRRDERLRILAADGDLGGIRVLSSYVARAFDDALARVGHRGPGEVELASRTFGDDPATLLAAAAAAAAQPVEPASPEGVRLSERMAANARASRELAYDATMRFTHELRMVLRELGSRRMSAELIDTVDDVYYLTCDELLTMPTDARLRIKRRRAERERLQAIRLPQIIDHAWAPLNPATAG